MGACLQLTVPTTMSRSACRGEKRGSAAPKRSRSYRAADTAMYSIPQQAVTNGYWKMEYLRAQPSPFETMPWRPVSASSRRVVMTGTPSNSEPISCLPPGRLPALVGPVEHALLPDVREAGHQRGDEDTHGEIAGPAQPAVP